MGGKMSIGLQGGMLSESFDGSKVDAGESGDPAFATTNVEAVSYTHLDVYKRQVHSAIINKKVF